MQSIKRPPRLSQTLTIIILETACGILAPDLYPYLPRLWNGTAERKRSSFDHILELYRPRMR